mmetsp:Transcript_9183/g.25788  ORF Transcript_9183/g.25788 Transcript_9183/m.25788 type:complete len:315 (+) Transcript_9183:415-1359(+)
MRKAVGRAQTGREARAGVRPRVLEGRRVVLRPVHQAAAVPRRLQVVPAAVRARRGPAGSAGHPGVGGGPQGSGGLRQHASVLGGVEAGADLPREAPADPLGGRAARAPAVPDTRLHPRGELLQAGAPRGHDEHRDEVREQRRDGRRAGGVRADVGRRHRAGRGGSGPVCRGHEPQPNPRPGVRHLRRERPLRGEAPGAGRVPGAGAAVRVGHACGRRARGRGGAAVRQEDPEHEPGAGALLARPLHLRVLRQGVGLEELLAEGRARQERELGRHEPRRRRGPPSAAKDRAGRAGPPRPCARGTWAPRQACQPDR